MFGGKWNLVSRFEREKKSISIYRWHHLKYGYPLQKIKWVWQGSRIQSIHKNNLCFHTSSEQSEVELRTPLILALKRTEYVIRDKYNRRNAKFILCCLVTRSCPTLLRPHGYIALQAPLSMGFPRQQYLSRLPSPSPGDLPNPGLEPTFPTLSGRFFTTEPPGNKPVLKEQWLQELSPLPREILERS